MPIRNEKIRARCVRIGWTLLAIAVLAIAVPIAVTAAQPHAVWLFTMSYGSVGLVVGSTLVRAGRTGEAHARGRGGSILAS
jgi:hypothetical protein